MPLLKPALMVALIFRTLSSFLIFDVIYVMTGGGPGTSHHCPCLPELERAFLTDLDFGYGGAISVALIIMALADRGDLRARLPGRADMTADHRAGQLRRPS